MMEPLDMDSLMAEPAPLHWERLGAGPADAPRHAQTLPNDPLALALPWLVRHLGVADALAAVMAADEPGSRSPLRDRARQAAAANSSARLLPALQRIGFDAHLVRCPLHQLRPPRLPAVLLLRGGDACVLTDIRPARGGQRVLHLVMPGTPALAFDVPAEEVAREYTGVALLVQRQAPAAESPDGPSTQATDATHTNCDGAAFAAPRQPAGAGALKRLASALDAALAIHPPGGRPGEGGFKRLATWARQARPHLQVARIGSALVRTWQRLRAAGAAVRAGMGAMAGALDAAWAQVRGWGGLAREAGAEALARCGDWAVGGAAWALDGAQRALQRWQRPRAARRAKAFKFSAGRPISG